MAGKASVFASRRLWFAIDRLSKNALIDLVVDRSRAQIGEDASDEQIADYLQPQINTVQRERGDRPLSLMATMCHLDKDDEDYRNKTGRHRQVPLVDGKIPTLGELAGEITPEKIREAQAVIKARTGIPQ
jgi:hypothetical protein